MQELTRHLETAKEKYDSVVFNTDALFNKPAPDPIIAFAIGGVSLSHGMDVCRSEDDRIN